MSIKIENVEVVGIEHAIRGMRNPKNSWNRSDSGYGCTNGELCRDCTRGYCEGLDAYIKIGPKDQELMADLAAGGPVHAKYRRMIVVYLDITAPLYWWKEFDTYKVGTVANSCSTMHKIHDKEFTLDDFSCEQLDEPSKAVLSIVINELNNNRGWFNNYNRLVADGEFTDIERKQFWWNMIQLLPSSYNQKRTIMLNYEVLVGIYKWRKNHKLDEWREFCQWIESLPYSELITGEEKKMSTRMKKCQFEGCYNEAIHELQVLVGPCEESAPIHICEHHFRAMTFDYTCSCEIVSVREKEEKENA